MALMENTAQAIVHSIPGQVEHWLGCPVNGYLGQDYGSPVKDMLQTPMSSGLANDIIGKAKLDVPVLKGFPGRVNVYAYDIDMDKKGLVFEVPGAILRMGAE